MKRGALQDSKMPVLIPPEHFGLVEPQVYRSDIFVKQHFPFISQLKLKTILFLSMEAASRSLRNFVKQHNICLIHIGFTTWKPDKTWKSVSVELVKEGLETILNTERHPLLVMCTSGLQETGTLVGCLRRMQCWHLSSVLDEYHRYAGSRSRYSNEQFIELFDADVVTLPRRLPSWFQCLINLREQEREEKNNYALNPNFNGKEQSNFFYLNDFGCQLVTPEAEFDQKLSLAGEEDKD